MPLFLTRLNRERRTIGCMIDLYCRANHATGQDLCPQCRALRAYALLRLEKCPFGEAKPTCANCRVHCYKPDLREQVRQVMRFAGPRMLLRHPVLALLHLLDGWKTEEKANH